MHSNKLSNGGNLSVSSSNFQYKTHPKAVQTDNKLQVISREPNYYSTYTIINEVKLLFLYQLQCNPLVISKNDSNQCSPVLNHCEMSSATMLARKQRCRILYVYKNAQLLRKSTQYYAFLPLAFHLSYFQTEWKKWQILNFSNVPINKIESIIFWSDQNYCDKVISLH